MLHRAPLAVLLLSICVLLSGLGTARAQQSITINALDFARAAIAKGDYALARQVLNVLVAHDPGDVETNFLLAETDLYDNRLDAAIARFRKILAAHPELVRVRLDYALALFKANQDDNAEYNFYLALDANLPEAVRANVMAYLHAIRARRRFDYSVAASIAPDTNLNAGTGQTQITLFGLPFTPSQTLRRRSGVGAVVAVSGEYRYPLADQWRWHSDGTLWRAEYPGGHFDDMILRTEVGPQYLAPDWDLAALGVYTERWYGNDPFDAGAGPRIEGAYHGFQRWRLEADAEYLLLGFHTETFENGSYFDANFYPNYYLPPTAFLRPIFGILHDDTRSSAFSAQGYRLGLGYHQELPHAITVEIQAEAFWTYYDGVDALFGTTRRDETLRLSDSIYRRDWIVFGFNPVFTVIFTRNASNQALFAYRRYQFQLGFTKEF
jgi:outer membrane protein